MNCSHHLSERFGRLIDPLDDTPVARFVLSEVDVVLEGDGARIVGIEIKAGATISANDFKGLKKLAEATGDRFHRGVLLYTGHETLPFGKQMHALPVSALWRVGRSVEKR